METPHEGQALLLAVRGGFSLIMGAAGDAAQQEIEEVGSYHATDYVDDKAIPEDSGLWVWEGTIYVNVVPVGDYGGGPWEKDVYWEGKFRPVESSDFSRFGIPITLENPNLGVDYVRLRRTLECIRDERDPDDTHLGPYPFDAQSFHHWAKKKAGKVLEETFGAPNVREV